MEEFTFIAFLRWLYQDYSIVFIICLIGSFTHDIYDTAKNGSKINIKSIISSSLICSILLSAVIESLGKYSINTRVAICFFMGLWSNNIIGYVINWNFVKRLFCNYLKNTKGSLSKSLNNAIEEIDSDDEKTKSDEKD